MKWVSSADPGRRAWRAWRGSRNLISTWESGSPSVKPHSLGPRGQQPARLLWPWNSPGKNTGVGYHSLLQRIFLTEGLNTGLLHCRHISWSLSHQGSPSQHTVRANDEQVRAWATLWGILAQVMEVLQWCYCGDDCLSWVTCCVWQSALILAAESVNAPLGILSPVSSLTPVFLCLAFSSHFGEAHPQQSPKKRAET